MSLPAQACVTRLEEIVGGAYVLTDPADLKARQVDGKLPSAVVHPWKLLRSPKFSASPQRKSLL